MINFVIVAAVVYFALVVPVNHLKKVAFERVKNDEEQTPQDVPADRRRGAARDPRPAPLAERRADEHRRGRPRRPVQRSRGPRHRRLDEALAPRAVATTPVSRATAHHREDSAVRRSGTPVSVAERGARAPGGGTARRRFANIATAYCAPASTWPGGAEAHEDRARRSASTACSAPTACRREQQHRQADEQQRRADLARPRTSRSGLPWNSTLDSTTSTTSTSTTTPRRPIHGSRPTSTSDSTIAMMARRSAMGSIALPSFEPWSNLRAMKPSAQSLTPSTTSDDERPPRVVRRRRAPRTPGSAGTAPA